MLFSEVVVICW